MPQRRKPDQPRSMKVGVSMPEDVAAVVRARAVAAGHYNFSAIVVAAVREYLLRHPQEEEEDDPAAKEVPAA